MASIIVTPSKTIPHPIVLINFIGIPNIKYSSSIYNGPAKFIIVNTGPIYPFITAYPKHKAPEAKRNPASRDISIEYKSNSLYMSNIVINGNINKENPKFVIQLMIVTVYGSIPDNSQYFDEIPQKDSPKMHKIAANIAIYDPVY